MKTKALKKKYKNLLKRRLFFNNLSIEELNTLKEEMQEKFGLVSIDKEDLRHYFETGKY